MIVDSSVFVALLLDEPDGDVLGAKLNAHPVVLSAATLTEASIVLWGRAAEPMVQKLDELLEAIGATVASVDEQQARIARDAYRRYGRGSGHPARLNYGDCFSYALAIARDEPLLFTGDDFVHTDVRIAVEEL
ncbi:type II toxin-antitoxin system VapC family toxin [Microbacterium sp. ARD32]|uniref:type II toxin-antitoxin system VapC family toxin n=1 Tax=Microbacterium sp. ARD32 TaxID=2962577 RepID=UPI0028817421|nr:type II toxin-antitoxin system VapC family toxin [Microbacterium sp. ARD32]MDT0156060.1 type II toxin-antitoxin system VapC family toxin [Microbacterium sp. ARD32]